MHIPARLWSAALLSLLGVTAPARGAAPAKPAAGHATVVDPGAEGDGDVKIGPIYADAPELTVREGTAKGTLHEFTMNSEDSKIYPGIKGKYQRKVCVYVPAKYAAGTAAPFIVVQDGLSYKKTLPPTLDTLIADGRLPGMVAVLVNSGGGDAQGSERGLEYDTVSDRYASWVEAELLPRVAKECQVAFTTDPEGRATMGGSSGGAAAFTMAWFRPDLYRRVLTYSGTYVNQQSPQNPKSPHGAWEYHEHFIPAAERKPLRIWMEVGEHDNGSNKDEQSLHNWVMANNRMAASLKAKGYHYRYEFAQDAKHVDGRVVRQTLPEAMVWLWRGYPVK
jgi:enterochelin esterase family protein